MFVIILFSLVLSVLVTGAALFTAFLHVAFAHELHGTAGRRGVTRLRGRDEGTQGARCQLAQTDSGGSTSAKRCSTEATGPAEYHAPKCRFKGNDRSPISVTPPEAVAIADYLRATRSPESCKKIAARTQWNSESMAARGRNLGANEALPCSLLEADGTCMAFSVRPISCRTCAVRHEQDNRRFIESSDVTAEAEREAEQGLSQGLRAAGLDGNRYELNGILAVALEIPDAAQQWGHGEDIFRHCRTV